MHFVTGRTLPRRTFLRGAGVTLALPLLDAVLAFSPEDGPAMRLTELCRQYRQSPPDDTVWDGVTRYATK